MHIVLVEPEIPNNTGNIGRLCVCTRTPLHLVGKLGFSLDAKMVRRAGLDYWHRVDLRLHATFDDFLKTVSRGNLYFFTTKARRPYTQVHYTDDDYLIFGSETRGLPESIRQMQPGNNLKIPMMDEESRSLNLAHAAAIALYEGLRQVHRDFETP